MSMQPLLIELGVEELPVKALPGLAQAFFDGVVDGLARRGIAFERDDAKRCPPRAAWRYCCRAWKPSSPSGTRKCSART